MDIEQQVKQAKLEQKHDEEEPVLQLPTDAWHPLNPQFSQTKTPPFTEYNNDFFQKNQIKEPQDIFKCLLPKKIIAGICAQLNQCLREKFGRQTDEANLRKKLYKQDQIYEFFGVKILMGYMRMPEPEDYFNEKSPFQCQIGSFIKEGRFKCVESWTKFSDEMLDLIKQPKNKPTNSHEIIPRIMKKINKIAKQAWKPSQNLAIIRNEFFEQGEEQSQLNLNCLLLCDSKNQYILSMVFPYQKYSNQVAFKMLSSYQSNNHKLYFNKQQLTLAQVHHLSMNSLIHSIGYIDADIDQECASNGTVMLMRNGEREYLASTVDGLHRYSATDKRAFAQVQLADHLKRCEQYTLQSEQYRCQFSCIDLCGSLFTEVIEMVLWNSFVCFRDLFDATISFIEFRLHLAVQLLSAKLKTAIQNCPQLPLPRAKTNSVGNQTDRHPLYFQMAPRAPISKFHIPTLQQVTTLCIVCQKNNPQITQCVNCSDVSGKMISLCPEKCFYDFHQSPREWVCFAEDLQDQSGMVNYPVPQQTIQIQQQSVPPQVALDEQPYAFNTNELEQYDDVWNDEQYKRRPGRPKGARNRKTLIAQAMNDPMMPNQGFDFENGTQMEEGF